MGNRLPGELLRGERLAYDFNAGQRMREGRSSPRVDTARGRAARREAASLLATADRRMGERRSCAQDEQRQGELRDVKRPVPLREADRRMVRRLPCNIRRKPARVEGAA